MKQALVFLAFLAVASATDWAKGLRGKFGLSGVGETSFINVPSTQEEAEAAKYTPQTRASGMHLPELVLYCPPSSYSPPSLCPLFDDNGFIAGLQVAVEASKFTNYFDLETMGLVPWTVNGVKYWAITQYFVTKEYLSTPAEERKCSRDETSTLQLDSVWVTGTYGKLYEVPRSLNNIGRTSFLKEACLAGMGLHYYYNMSTTTECTAEGIFPWFPLYDEGNLIGMGWINVGPLAAPDNSGFDWFERPPLAIIKQIISSGPECLFDLSTSPGALSMHTYYVDTPNLIPCPSA